MNWKKLISNNRIRRSTLTDQDIRNEFESDYGRIIYSPALRRMHDKTQVFPLTTDDNIHSRLTHSNEVMSLGYTFGLKLSRSNVIQQKTGWKELELVRKLPILLQNVCLVHDIGNAPFGHFGETIVSDYFKKLNDKKHINFYKLNDHQKRDFINYDGNAQGLRVLTKLQYLDNPFGLNLTYATLGSYLKYPNFGEINDNVELTNNKDGVLLKTKHIEKSKHGVFFSEKEYFEKIAQECGLKVNNRYLRHPLCYLMEAADSIAYLCMDMEDGFNKCLFDIQYINESFKNSQADISIKVRAICDDKFLKPNTKIVNIRIALIAYFVELAYTNFETNLEKIEIGEYDKELIKDDSEKIHKILQQFSVKKIFTSREINYLESTGHSVFVGLLDFYIEFIFNLNKKYIKRAKSLISKSIIECAIEENIIQIGDSKLQNKIKQINEDIHLFQAESDYVEELKEELKRTKAIEKEFGLLKKEYKELFDKQFTTVLNNSEKNQLQGHKQQINKLIDPDFEDLDDYNKFRVILDFISGMTDQYALSHYQKISGQKSFDITDINNKAQHFLDYLKNKVSTQVYDFLNELSTYSEVLIFSGVLRNYFLKYYGEIRDLDLVVNCDESIIESFVTKFNYRKNSFGGYKITIDSFSIDLWHIEKTWAFLNSKVEPELFKNYNLPNTAFFNFSSVIFDLNRKKFIFNSSFKKFLETKEIDLVLDRNPLPELCIVNTIYYKEKFKLNLSSKLKKYCITHFGEYNEEQFYSIQLKHFDEIKFEYQYLKEYLKIFERDVMSIEEPSLFEVGDFEPNMPIDSIYPQRIEKRPT